MPMTRALLRTLGWRIPRGMFAGICVSLCWLFWATAILGLVACVAPIELIVAVAASLSHPHPTAHSPARGVPRPAHRPVQGSQCRWCGGRPGTCEHCGGPN